MSSKLYGGSVRILDAVMLSVLSMRGGGVPITMVAQRAAVSKGRLWQEWLNWS